jgi:hypothetical protein
MTYISAEARQQLLDAVAEATDEIAVALAALGAAYDALDEHTADRLEEELFRPVQMAYGRAKRLRTGFAERSGLPVPQDRASEPATTGSSSRGVKVLLDNAMTAIGEADGALATLQDSMMPVEVGDPQLRADLAEVRTLLGDLQGRSRRLVSVLGR